MANIMKCDLLSQLIVELEPQLSRTGLLSSEIAPRWSSFHAPRPAVVVNAETEQDVAKTIQYCIGNDIAFLAQNGGNGWATTFNLGSRGIIISLAQFKQVTFNEDKTRVSIGGGSTIKNVIDNAYAAGALVVTGNCNCVGALGAMLGGGYGYLMGLYGFGVDNIVSLRVVTSDGAIRQVHASSDQDLFWGLRGAAPNLGIVTSAEVISYPAAPDDMLAWTGAVIFSPDKLEKVVQAIEDLHLKPEMNIYMYFISGGQPDNAPVVIVVPFLHKGTVAEGYAAFSSIYDIGPITETTGVIPYNQWNSAADVFCSRGARKPAYSVGMQNMKPAVWRQVWNEYVEFRKRPTAEGSVIILEAFSLQNARQKSTSAAFPHRNVNFNALVIPIYEDSSLDHEAETYGSTVRKLWRDSDNLAKGATYVNFAHGDEELETVYGSSLSRLQSIKKAFDPENGFNQWFNLH